MIAKAPSAENLRSYQIYRGKIDQPDGDISALSDVIELSQPHYEALMDAQGRNRNGTSLLVSDFQPSPFNLQK